MRNFASKRKIVTLNLVSFAYVNFIKELFFELDPERVHTGMVLFGERFGSKKISKTLVNFLLNKKHPMLSQKIKGIEFSAPIGLAAGFDYEARLTQALAPWGFGFQSVGTITYNPYEGNPKPMLGRLPKSKSLMVNKGFKNLGALETIKKLQGKSFPIPLGISVGRTNSRTLLTQKESITDIINSFKAFEKSKIPFSYYELNISCPNLYGNVSFYPPRNLEVLLKEIDKLKIKKPIFVKMPIEKSNKEVLSMLGVIVKHCPVGVIIGNLQKDRTNKTFVKSEVSKFKVGNFSGKPTFERSNELISFTYKHFKNQLIIIGCGGIFSAEDAYEKIKRGASLVQLITGMIFEGPQLISQVNFGLEELLKAEGYSNISQSIGSKGNR